MAAIAIGYFPKAFLLAQWTMLNKLRIWMTFKLLIKCDETQSKPTQTYSRATVSRSAYTVHGVSNGFPPA